MNPAFIKVRVLQGALQGSEFVFDKPGPCVIGRGHDCDLRLPVQEGERDISRHHCVLDLEPPLLLIRDLGSLNGTFVNGVMIGHRPASDTPHPGEASPEYVLKDGDEIQIGHTVLRVCTMLGSDQVEPALVPGFVV